MRSSSLCQFGEAAGSGSSWTLADTAESLECPGVGPGAGSKSTSVMFWWF